MIKNSKELINLVNKCREEDQIGKRCQLLEYINRLMPIELRITIPSIITNTCIDMILSSMEEKLSPPIYTLA